MINGNSNSQLIIVSDEKSMKYAEYLKGYITPKALNCKCVIYKVKEYDDNRAKIASTNKIVFIGENKDIKKEYIIPKFENYGIFIGWHGNNALITTDGEPISKTEYNEMIEDANSRKLPIKAFSEADVKELDNLHRNGFWAYLGSGPILGRIRGFVEKHTNGKQSVSTTVIVNIVMGMSVYILGGFLGGYSVYASVKNLKRILSILDDQKHEYAIKLYVDELLKKFLEE